MLHAKFQDHRNFGSREEKFSRLFSHIYERGRGSTLGHMIWTIYTFFVPTSKGGSI